ncbi:MAG: carbon-nitrogen hydrolase family protein [Ardenticatenaceae bacterium]|nr:carbon-nitrogen hydrolase family protein [Ardenticatenaceae bacterium]
MKILTITGDTERLVLHFDADLDLESPRRPENYTVAGQHPAFVTAVGRWATLHGFRLEQKEHPVHIAGVAGQSGEPLDPESRRLTYLPPYRRRRVRVTAVQPLRITETGMDYPAYLRYVMTLVDRAGQMGSDVVCLPESVQYQPGKAKPDMFEPVSGPYGRMLMERAKRYGMYVLGALYERQGETLYNVAVLFDRQGESVWRYQKVFVVEGTHVVPGDTFPVHRTDFGVIGAMICFDMLFPEGPAIMGLRGAEIIFFPHGIGGIQTSEESVVTVSRARALDNCLYVVPNGFGRLVARGEGNFGRSCIINPSGAIVADAGHGPGLASAVIDLEEIRLAQGYGGPSLYNDVRARLIRERRADILQELADLARSRQEEMWFHQRYSGAGERKPEC